MVPLACIVRPMKPYARPTGRPRARRALPALLLLPLLLVLAGCFRLDMGLTINEDDTVDMSVEIADVTGMMSREDMPCSDLESELTGGPNEDVVDFTVTEIEDDDGNVGCRMEATGAPLDSRADDGGRSAQRVDDPYAPSLEGDPAGMGDMGDLEDMPAGMEPQVSIAVTFPGEVIEADGEIDGNTVTWTGLTAFASGGSATGHATGSGGGDNTVTWIILGVVILLALAALIFLLVKRGQNKSGAATPGAPDAAAPYGQAAAPHQAPADPGAGYPGQQPPAAPAPYTTAAADTPVTRPEGASFAPSEPAADQPVSDGPEQQDRPADPEEGQPR